MEHIRDAWSVGHEPAGLDLLAIAEQCRQPGAERRCNDARAVGTNESTDHDVKCVRLRLDRLDGGNDVLRSPDFGWSVSLSKTHARIYRWCSPPKMGTANV